MGRAAREVRAGHRLAFVAGGKVTEFITPTLAQLEPTEGPRLTLGSEDFDRLEKHLAKPPKANAELRRLMLKKR